MREQRSDVEVIDYYTTNLQGVYNRSSFKDEVDGGEWYSLGKRELRKISRETGFSLKRITWACAVLSNNTGWERNLDLVRSVAFQLRNDMEPTGHCQQLLDKAKRILVDGDFSALSGPKVIPFAQALWQPWSSVAVVDRWIFRAAYGDDPLPPSLSPGRLRRIQVALQRVAREVELPTTTVQAIIWLTIRRENSTGTEA